MAKLFDDHPDKHNIIDIRGVDQSYDEGKSFVMKNLDFIVEDNPGRGQFVVVLGMSGSGKSTLLRYIAGLQKPSAGTILLSGQPVSRSNRAGMVFQQYSSMPWMTVHENVALSLKYQGVDYEERMQRAKEMIDMVGLSGHEQKFAQYPNLSGGQLQRVAIARSLLANANILLMDEPFGALDVRTRLQMQDLLLDIWMKFHPTIVFVTHDIAEAVYLAEDIYILSAPPAQFVRHVKVDLSMERDRAIKRDPRYIELVQHVEDQMIEVSQLPQQ